MIRRLLIVAASAMVLAIISLSVAGVTGGNEIATYIGKHGTLVWDDDDDEERVTRTLEFDPTRPIEIDAPVRIDFTRGDKPSLEARATPSMMEALQWKDGELSFGGKPGPFHGTIRLKIVAPTMPSLTINGPGNVELHDLQQPGFKLTLNGPGNVEASGKVETLAVDASGAGNLDLESLEATNAQVHVAGIGNVDLSVTGTLEADISGAGNLALHRKPQVVKSSISGIGNISHDY